MTQRSRSWQSVLWREWRDCADDGVATNLLEQLCNEQGSWESVMRATAFWALIAALTVTLDHMLEKGKPTDGDPVRKVYPFLCFAIPTLCVVLFRITGKTWRAWFYAWGVAVKIAAIVSVIFSAILIPALLLVSVCAPDLHLASENYTFLLSPVPVGILVVFLFLFLSRFFPIFFTIVCIIRLLKREADRPGWDVCAPIARVLPLGWGAYTTPEEAQRAVAQAAKETGHDPWCRLSQRIVNTVERSRNLEGLARALQQDDWMERYAARFGIVRAGGEAVAVLEPLIQQKGDRRVQKSAIGLLREIARRTRSQLAYRAFGFACPEHLVRCHPHRERISWRSSVTYYGCRACHQSTEFLECPRGIVAVLDARTQEHVAQDGGSLRVNWLSFGTTFDFDRVEIIDATDEDVDRFVMQVGNDTDPVRQPRYRQMSCTIAADCPLPENTKRVLRHTFRRVVQRR